MPPQQGIQQPAYQAGPIQNKPRNNYNGCIIALVVACCVTCCVIILAIVLIVALVPEDSGPTPLGEETRVGNAYVGLFFLNENEIPAEAKQAFLNAAARWSLIVAGTSFPSVSLPKDTELCGGEVITSETLLVDHLMIAARVAPIDGVNNILGQAGPCARELNSFFPVFGIMDFDLADIDGMIQDDIVEPVILHEMGHVLGIGTLWQFAVQGQFVEDFSEESGLLRDPIFTTDAFGNLQVNANRQPRFIGTLAIDAFEEIGGSFSGVGVPVEDGTLNGNELFDNRADGQGSIDGHWDEDFMPGELMEFRIGASTTHPLSVVSLQSLRDLGYEVDVNQADDYDVNTASRSFTALRGKIYNLVGDVVDYSKDFLLSPSGEIFSMDDLA